MTPITSLRALLLLLCHTDRPCVELPIATGVLLDTVARRAHRCSLAPVPSAQTLGYTVISTDTLNRWLNQSYLWTAAVWPPIALPEPQLIGEAMGDAPVQAVISALEFPEDGPPSVRLWTLGLLVFALDLVIRQSDTTVSSTAGAWARTVRAQATALGAVVADLRRCADEYHRDVAVALDTQRHTQDLLSFFAGRPAATAIPQRPQDGVDAADTASRLLARLRAVIGEEVAVGPPDRIYSSAYRPGVRHTVSFTLAEWQEVYALLASGLAATRAPGAAPTAVPHRILHT